MNPLEAKLMAFDLTLTGAKIYLQLSTKPKQTVWQLSNTLSLPRTTIYDHLQKLIEKGLVERGIKYKSQEFSAASLDILQTSIESHKVKISQLTDDLTFLKQNIQSHQSLTQQTDVKYYHGNQGLKQMMWNSLAADREIVGYSVYGRAKVVGDKFITQWLKEFAAKGLRDRAIINPTPRTLNIIKDRVITGIHQQTVNDIKVLPKETMYISGDTMIYNHVFAVCWWLEGEVVGVEIHNPELVKAQKTIFETLWHLAEPIKPLLE